MPRPDLSRVPEWYHRYINQVKEDDLMAAFKNQEAEFNRFFGELPGEKRDYRYAEDKWTIREVLQHIIDGERVFAYRSLCIARKDKTPLPSFDENSYAENSKAGKREWQDMIEEFQTIRRGNEIMFKSFDAEQLDSTGTASGKSVYVLGLGYVLIGHVNHHIGIIRERYL
ncbi:MAG TPA: DinB family protein [Chitinophagaceae bacterium]|nr:DinB family protein [Chitinophagaceae bacterium]